MPRVIYCIHALSTHLFKLGKAPQIQDLYGKVNFTGIILYRNSSFLIFVIKYSCNSFTFFYADEEINAVSKELKEMGIQMPSFQKIGGLLTNNMSGDTAALHAAVIAVNQTLSNKV